MRRIFRPFALLALFGVGVGVGGLVFRGGTAVGEIERLQDRIRQLELEASTLQARLRVRESLDAQRASQQEASRAQPDEPLAGRSLAASAPVASAPPAGR